MLVNEIKQGDMLQFKSPYKTYKKLYLDKDTVTATGRILCFGYRTIVEVINKDMETTYIPFQYLTKVNK